jgi:hypothetical protein
MSIYTLGITRPSREAHHVQATFPQSAGGGVSRDEKILQHLRKPRNAYFNDAIDLYNKLWKRKALKEALVRDSALVAEDSLEVLEVFEQLEDELVE